MSFDDLDPVPASSDIQNLATFDPFADADEEEESSGLVHIRIQQRNGRKTLTTVQGLAGKVDLKKLLKAFKKNFNCNGTLVDDEELGQIIQVQGDQRKKIAEFIVEEGIAKKDKVKVHGF